MTGEGAHDGAPLPHLVLTIHLDDGEGAPTKAAEQRVFAFFRERLGVERLDRG